MIRVVIADDHRLVRQGIHALLSNARNINVVGEAEDGEEAISLVERLSPDVLVVDVSMPRLNGLEAAKRLFASGYRTPIVVLSMYGEADLVRRAFESGVSGYVLKQSTAAELVEAVRAAVDGERFLSSALEELRPTLQPANGS
ncbi:MAG TPA: response regulator transcription factor [Candidatus Sulfomarinibacteraceae bacterium]|nr:response regulator transcription factor [Candidatus Sulfomarinibacteraceae bacterium]